MKKELWKPPIEPPTPQHVVLCLSGGLDSTVLLHDLVGKEFSIFPLLFDYGQTHIRELDYAVVQCQKLNLPFVHIDLPPLLGSTITDGQGNVVLPGRNAVFLSTAANYAAAKSINVVAMGCNKDDAFLFPDCRPVFVSAFNAMLTACELAVSVWCPYLEKTKSDIVAIGKALGVDFSSTWSCYLGRETPCGYCLPCRQRKEHGA